MSSTVNSIDTVFSAAPPPVAAKDTAALTAQSPSSSGASTPSVLVHNPRVVLDPTAGFITEYLSANGSQVVSQTPSAVTVAYLRQGLDPDGLPKNAGSVATTA